MRIKFFPISFFAPILGFGGLTIVMQKMEAMYGFGGISDVLLGITILIILVSSFLYFSKAIFFPQEVKKDFQHPVKINFFPALPKGLLILSIVFLTISTGISKGLWIVGASVNLLLTLVIFREYISKSFELKHINGAWFIPIVTNIVVPITGMVVFPEYAQISWAFFAIGLVFWLVLFFVIMYRIIFHNPLPEKLLPTMAILIAPPSIGFISWLKLTGGVLNPFAYILFYLAVFLFFLLLIDVKKFFKIKFYLSWWAYSFPLAAFTLAITLMYHTSHLEIFKYFATIVGLLLVVVVILLVLKTAQAIKQKSLCVEEEE